MGLGLQVVQVSVDLGLEEVQVSMGLLLQVVQVTAGVVAAGFHGNCRPGSGTTGLQLSEVV